jgi:hypothetical protein
MKLIVISSSTTGDLMNKAEAYNISQVGSLTVSNGHYFVAFLGEPKVQEDTIGQPKVTKEPKVTKKASPSA